MSAHRKQLIRRCRDTAIQDSQRPVGTNFESDVALLLDRLVAALGKAGNETQPDPLAALASAMEERRAASARGEQMQECGFSVGQVVHEFGGICQAITGLANERGQPISPQEFQTLNGFLDAAIADAVASYEHHRDLAVAEGSHLDLHLRMGMLADEQRRSLSAAFRAFEAMKANDGAERQASTEQLECSLLRLRDLIDRSLPELRLATGMTAAKAASPSRPSRPS